MNKKDSPYKSFLAGGIAGAVEAGLTYPTEFVKTQLQLPNSHLRFKGPIDCLLITIRTQGVLGIYQGVSAMILGTAAKASVRFLVYDHFKLMFTNKETNTISAMGSLTAGLLAGISEAILVVTPTETIKTKLIADSNSQIKKYRGLIHGISTMLKEEGPLGIYRGVGPVIARQALNQAIRLSVYQQLKDLTYTNFDYSTKSPLPIPITFGLGMIAGTITVYTTMPVDVVKTKMQSPDRIKYKNSINCLLKTVQQEGLKALWAGATPRLARLLFSGGIVFSVYEQVMFGLNKIK